MDKYKKLVPEKNCFSLYHSGRTDHDSSQLSDIEMVTIKFATFSLDLSRDLISSAGKR